MFIKNPAYVPLGGESANLLPDSHVGQRCRLKMAFVVQEQSSLPDRINGAIFKMVRDFRRGAVEASAQRPIDNNVDLHTRATMEVPRHELQQSSSDQPTVRRHTKNDLGEFVRDRQAVKR